MKTCPHCRKRTISLYQWYTASYQYPTECEGCKRTFAYGGWQLLIAIVLGFMFFLFITIFVSSSIHKNGLYMLLWAYAIGFVAILTPVKYNNAKFKMGRWCSTCNSNSTPKSSFWQRQCDVCRKKC